jgi:hypothetical protein
MMRSTSFVGTSQLIVGPLIIVVTMAPTTNTTCIDGVIVPCVAHVIA